jgi:SAM-dependent methyltransferase
MQQRRMAPTTVLSGEAAQAALLEHERVFFPSYPWEWGPSQWMEAAELTLDLCEEALEQGLILKDATPLNILFCGPRAIFVDVLSFERRELKSSLWMAYAQFARTFLLPLCAYAYCGWPLSATQQRRDGYEPADLAPYLPLLSRWRRPLLSLVTLPLLLQNKTRFANVRPLLSEEAAAYALRRLLRSTRKVLRSLSPGMRDSRWSDYTQNACHYKPQDNKIKQLFVRNTLELIRPARVLDVGANTGVYSRIAAECGAYVVAWDTDVQATNLNWRTAHSAGLSILPLVADFARPAPPVGWRNRESAGLLDRARGQFDCVLMLGILHHLLVADQIPLVEILEQLWEISTHWAILEWMPRQDSQFDELCRGRQMLFSHLSEDYFVQAIAKRFAVRGREQLPNGRSLWFVERLP